MWWLENKPLSNSVKFNISLNLTYSKLYIIYILKQFYTFSIGFDFQQCLLFMYNEGIIYNNILNSPSQLFILIFILKWGFMYLLVLLYLLHHSLITQSLFCNCIYLKRYFETFNIIVLFKQEVFFLVSVKGLVLLLSLEPFSAAIQAVKRGRFPNCLCCAWDSDKQALSVL